MLFDICDYILPPKVILVVSPQKRKRKEKYITLTAETIRVRVTAEQVETLDFIAENHWIKSSMSEIGRRRLNRTQTEGIVNLMINELRTQETA